MFFYRRNALDTPGVKAILITGFVALSNIMLLASLLLNWSGHDMGRLIGPATLKFLVVIILLGSWLVNYYLFWHNGRLLTVLQKFEEHTASYNQVTAILLAAFFFILPVILFIVLAVHGANIRN